MRRTLTALVVIALLRVTALSAQEGGPDPNSVRVRLGPLMMNPTISVSNIGIDHNVFNDPPGTLPKEDFTVTVTPSTDFWLHAGPTWVTASLNETINWYQEYSSERNANTQYKLGWIVPGSRVSFKINGTYLNAHDRPGFEIDTRAGRKETQLEGALDFHAMSRSFIGLTANRQETRFAEDAAYQSTNLQLALNRVTIGYGLNFRHQLTPLTSITFAGTQSNDRFEFSPERNTKSTSAQMSMSFAPAALIKDGLSFGYTDFTPLAGDVPGYRGMI